MGRRLLGNISSWSCCKAVMSLGNTWKAELHFWESCEILFSCPSPKKTRDCLWRSHHWAHLGLRFRGQQRMQPSLADVPHFMYKCERKEAGMLSTCHQDMKACFKKQVMKVNNYSSHFWLVFNQDDWNLIQLGLEKSNWWHTSIASKQPHVALQGTPASLRC